MKKIEHDRDIVARYLSVTVDGARIHRTHENATKARTISIMQKIIADLKCISHTILTRLYGKNNDKYDI